MRVAIDVRATQTAHRERGIGRSVFDLVHALAQYGGSNEYGLLYQTSLPCPLEDLPDNFRLVPVQGPLLNHAEQSLVMRIPRLRSRPTGRRWNDAIMRRRHLRGLRQAIESFSPDVFHAASPIDVFTDTVGDFGCRKIVTFFDAIPRIDPANHYDRQPDVQRWQYDRQFDAVAEADAIVAISRSSADQAIRYAGAPPEKTIVVHLAVSDDFASPSCADVTEFTQGEPYFLFLSSLDPHKNPEAVLRAFAEAELAGHRLVFLSSEKGPLYRRICELRDELGLTERVVVTGVVSEASVRALVQGATALVSPSFLEGFGLPCAQAMGAGVPVIVSNRYSQPEIVADAGIQVDPDDHGSISKAMSRLAKDAGISCRSGQKGRRKGITLQLRTLGTKHDRRLQGKATVGSGAGKVAKYKKAPEPKLPGPDTSLSASVVLTW